MRHAQRWLVAAVSLVALARGVEAQTATPTPTNTPTITLTPIPSVAQHRRNNAPLNLTLLDAATTATRSGAQYVGGLFHKSVQVTVGASMTSYTLVIETLNGGLYFAVPPTPSGMPASITEATVAAGATKIFDLNHATQFVQARISAITDCTVSVYLHASGG